MPVRDLGVRFVYYVFCIIVGAKVLLFSDILVYFVLTITNFCAHIY